MITFPLTEHDGCGGFPKESKCLVCGTKVGEVEGFIRLTVGALLYHNRNRDVGGPSERMDAIFSVWYHGPHQVLGKTEDGRLILDMNNEERDIAIVDSLRGGQADIRFCSKACLSSFFTQIVDSLPNGPNEPRANQKISPCQGVIDETTDSLI